MGFPESAQRYLQWYNVPLLIFGFGFPAPLPAQDLQEVANSLVLLQFVPERHIGINPVPQAAAFFLFRDIFVGFQVVDDITCGFFRDTDRRRYFSGGDARFLGD